MCWPLEIVGLWVTPIVEIGLEYRNRGYFVACDGSEIDLLESLVWLDSFLNLDAKWFEGIAVTAL
jgi:hypothetical protein